MTRTTNILKTEEVVEGVKPTTWPQYEMGPKARPESNREGHCYPVEAEHVGVKVLPTGWSRDSRRRKVADPVLFDQNVNIPMRDGIKLSADVFRSPKTENGALKVPTVLMYGPYGKSGTGPLQLERVGPYRLGIPFDASSGLESFEGLDPVNWIPRGYAIVNCDSRGSWKSEGDHWAAPDRQSGIDGYDVVEWIASQPWSNGKVTMAGNSRLATVQYFVAAEQPPSLACIAPWEGIVDEYRSAVMRGGRPNFSFNNFIVDAFIGNNSIKDLRKSSLLPKHEYDDDFWANIRPDISRINIPLYVLASYTTGLHAVGSVQVFRDAVGEKKWLRFHDSQEWYDIAKKESLDDLQAFYDAYCLTGSDGDSARKKWEKEAPTVRNCILPMGEKRGIVVPSQEYPPPVKQNLELFLDSNGKMCENMEGLQAEEESTSYDSEVYRASASFEWVADRKVVLVGMPQIVLHVQPDDHSVSGDEMDVVVLVKKIDQNGKPMKHISIPLNELQATAPSIDQEAPKTQDDVVEVQTLTYYGPQGIMRLSHRTVDVDLKGDPVDLVPGYPHHPHTREAVESAKAEQIEAFKNNKPVAFQTGLWPMGMVIEKGEGLRLEVGGNILWSPEFEILRPLQIKENENKGLHRVYFGKAVNHDSLGHSRLVLPVVDFDM